MRAQKPQGERTKLQGDFFDVLGGYDPSLPPPRIRQPTVVERALEKTVERLRLIESQQGGARNLRPSLALELFASELRRLEDES